MQGKTKYAKRLFAAWILLGLFMLPMVVKTLHTCQLEVYKCSSNAATSHHHDTSKHNTDDCSICNFVFHSFVKAPEINLESVQPIVVSEVFKAYVEKLYSISKKQLLLRGPPTKFLF